MSHYNNDLLIQRVFRGSNLRNKVTNFLYVMQQYLTFLLIIVIRMMMMYNSCR